MKQRVAFVVSTAAAFPAVDRGSARLTAMLTERLMHEGFEVVPTDAEPDLVVSLSLVVPDCVLRAALPSRTVTRRVPKCGTTLADDQLELVHKATELVRSIYQSGRFETSPVGASSPQRESRSGHPSLAPPPVTAVATVASPTKLTLPEVSMGADLRARRYRVDPVARMGARLPLGSWALHLESGLSKSTRTSLDVTEGHVLFGFGRVLRNGGLLRIELAPLAGALVHRFRAEGDSGTRLGLVGTLTLVATVRLTGHVAIDARIAPGYLHAKYTHVAGNEEVWSGDRFQIDTGISVVFF